MRVHRRRGATEVLDDDAIWRGEIPDHLIVMTAAERERLDAERLRASRRRTLVELFGEPVGAVAAEHPDLHHRRNREIRRADMVDQCRAAGCREEIQVSILSHPVDAVDLIAERGLLDDVDGIDVDPATEERADKQIAWDASLRTTPWSRRAARLRLYGSPSANVTVITLTPRRTRRSGVRLFLRAGLRSLFDLRDSLESGLDHSGRT